MKKIKDIKIAIVSSVFRREVSKALEKNALKVFKEKGLTKNQVEIFQTPGSWEIPVVVKRLAKSKKYDAILTFGAIAKGETYHFEQISNECARALMDISVQFEIPVVFEVLAVYNLKDALIRATRKVENKGEEAAHTALEMINTLSKIK